MTNIKNFVSKKINEKRAQVMDEYSQRLVELTLKYQKKYGFELNYQQGHEHLTWNCDGDAFKHVFGFYENEFNPVLAPSGSNNDLGIHEMLKQYYDNDYHLPTREELDSRVNTGKLVYVHDYVRADGTKVSGYYRAYPRG